MITKDNRRIISGYNSTADERKDCLTTEKQRVWEKIEKSISDKDTGTIDIVKGRNRGQQSIIGKRGEKNPWGVYEGTIGNTIDYCVQSGIFTKKEIETLAGTKMSKINSHLDDAERRERYFSHLNSTGSICIHEKFSDAIDDLESHQKDLNGIEKTEQKTIIKSRIGQGDFRMELIKFWNGQCSVSSLSNTPLLRASHIKPWRDSANHERLDPMNGLLLHPTLDHLFDSGYISFDEKGVILISDKLSKFDIEILHIHLDSKLKKRPPELMKYMKYHRTYIFRKNKA